jgi:cytochrome bd ubiquinol oxidase subunit I
MDGLLFGLDALLLARIQFAATIAFHYIYPPMSIGLGVVLVIMEAVYLKTGDELYRRMARFWVKIFGLTFSMGVATGIVMEFQFGTNWSTYSRFVGDVFGSALAAEGIFAFFLESGFLAILLFGWNRISPRMHFFSTLMVALGAHFSAIWIVVANSWMQTPAGYHVVQYGATSRAEITDFWAMVFNPSSVERLSHVVSGAWLAGATLVLSVSAWHMLKDRHVELSRASFRIALGVAVVASLFQLISGHASALVVAKHQPAKLAAYEGHFETSAPADLWLFGVVDEREETVKYGIAVPGGLSLLVHGDPRTPVTGLNAFAPADRPPIQLPFQAYHIMIAIGMGLIALTLAGVVALGTGKLYTSRPLLWLFVFSVLGPQIANQAGWMAAEVGRQPWIVYNLMRTADAVSPTVSAREITASIALFGFIYLLLFILFIFLLDQKIRHGPEETEEHGVTEHRA